MSRYIIKRILLLIPTLLVLSFLVFTLMSFSGDPAAVVAGEEATPEQLEAIRERMGLNDPLLVRYYRYITGILRGDLGKGIYGNDVWEEFSVRIPYTIILAIASLIITVVIAIPFGIIAGVKKGGWMDTICSAFAMAGLAAPNFWLGMMLIILFSVKLQWLPTSGASGPTSIIMPAFTLACSYIAIQTRMTRSSMIDQMSADYLRTARAKGVKESRVVLKHALGNAWIPIITMLGSNFSGALGGAVVIECVFAWPGVGDYLLSCIRWGDSQMVTTFVILITAFSASVLLAVDILYAYVDPRIKARYTKK